MEGIIKGIIKLNPLTEIILLISVSIIGFTNESIKMDILILVIIVMISSCTGLTRTSIKALSIFAILQGIKYFIFPILPDRIAAHFGLLVVHVPKLIPIFFNPVTPRIFIASEINVRSSLKEGKYLMLIAKGMIKLSGKCILLKAYIILRIEFVFMII